MANKKPEKSKINRYTPTDVFVKERRKEVLNLRIQGFSYRDILKLLQAGTMGADGHLTQGYDERDVHDDMSIAMKELESTIIEDARLVRRIELERLDDLYKIANNSALGGSMRGISMCLKIMERRAHLLGLDHPSRVDIHSWQNEVVELIKQGKITLDQVRKELGENAVAGLLESGGPDFVEGAIASITRAEQDEESDDGSDQEEMAGEASALGIEPTDPIPFGAGDGLGEQLQDDGDAGWRSGGKGT